jgi:16S rRNA (guanine527-N7)-methyltransferase
VDTPAIAQLLQPYIQLDESRLSAISKYIDLLLKWNARINLTAIREPEEIVRRHFGESFFVANRLLSQRPAKTAVDLGSGAGFPGVPLAILAPEVQVTLIEAQQKKATFLRELISQLGLGNAKVFADRGEKFNQVADIVTMRAVESFSTVLPVAVRLANPGGCIALLIGAAQEQTARDVEKAVEWNDPVQIPGGHSRILLVGTKLVKVG